LKSRLMKTPASVSGPATGTATTDRPFIVHSGTNRLDEASHVGRRHAEDCAHRLAHEALAQDADDGIAELFRRDRVAEAVRLVEHDRRPTTPRRAR
jgi:hypothetical protein